MKKKIRKGRLRPVATFSIDPKRKVKVVTQHTLTADEIGNSVQHGPVNDTLIILETVEKSPKDKNVDKSSRGKTERNFKKERRPKNLVPPRAREAATVELRDENETLSERNYTITTATVGDESETSPVIVAAVVFTLLLLQIPLMCKC